MARQGNHGPDAVQNLYRCADVVGDGDPDDWVAIAVETDGQWAALSAAVDRPEWPAELVTAAARRQAHEEIDTWLSSWCRQRSGDAVVAALWPAGVPVARVLAPAQVQHLPQLQARRFLEWVTHPVAGDQVHYGYPVRFSAGPERVHRAPAPTLGQHNREVLIGLLGVSEEEFARLEADDVIGTRLLGQHRTR
jgi:crotonobetainyl-CoA:carnitine CoA-transferase CaiB-like acyl-CoA transferase